MFFQITSQSRLWKCPTNGASSCLAIRDCCERRLDISCSDYRLMLHIVRELEEYPVLKVADGIIVEPRPTYCFPRSGTSLSRTQRSSEAGSSAIFNTTQFSTHLPAPNGLINCGRGSLLRSSRSEPNSTQRWRTRRMHGTNW
jgi:hypothetical protein